MSTNSSLQTFTPSKIPRLKKQHEVPSPEQQNAAAKTEARDTLLQKKLASLKRQQNQIEELLIRVPTDIIPPASTLLEVPSPEQHTDSTDARRTLTQKLTPMQREQNRLEKLLIIRNASTKRAIAVKDTAIAALHAQQAVSAKLRDACAKLLVSLDNSRKEIAEVEEENADLLDELYETTLQAVSFAVQAQDLRQDLYAGWITLPGKNSVHGHMRGGGSSRGAQSNGDAWVSGGAHSGQRAVKRGVVGSGRGGRGGRGPSGHGRGGPKGAGRSG
ncbi:hypothetical protein LTR08_002440 [Meristemomyces frigidus]|nr:hypothetical protein LTR08_002440 [Meristemomyces frigidus]